MKSFSIFILIAALSLAFPTLRASQAGAEMNEADAALNTVYKKLMASISEPGQKTALIQAQKAWIQYRDENVALFAARYPYSKGGLFLNIHLTKERTAYLQALLDTSPKDDPEGIKPSGYE